MNTAATISAGSRPGVKWTVVALSIPAIASGLADVWFKSDALVHREFATKPAWNISTAKPKENIVTDDSVRAESMRVQRAYLLRLEPGWDGYDATRIATGTIDGLLTDLAQALAGIPCPAPDLIPGGDGSLQAEWHHNAIEVLYHWSPDGQRYLSVSKPGGTELEFFGVDALDALQKWAPQLVLAPSVAQLAA